MLHASWQVPQALLQKDRVEGDVVKGIEGKPAHRKGGGLVCIKAGILRAYQGVLFIVERWMVIKIDAIIEADFVIRDAIGVIDKEVLNHPEQAHHLNISIQL